MILYLLENNKLEFEITIIFILFFYFKRCHIIVNIQNKFNIFMWIIYININDDSKSELNFIFQILRQKKFNSVAT